MTVGKKPNIAKGIYITFILSFFSLFGKGQELIEMNITLEPGGKIYDVVESPFGDAYIIVGDFVMTSPFSRKNFIVVNKSDFTVNDDAFYQLLNGGAGVNGIIRSVEVATRNITDGFGAIIAKHRYIFFGGEFTWINEGGNNDTVNGFASFRSIENFGGPFPGVNDFAHQNIALDFDYSGNPNNVIQPGWNQGIYDMIVDEDSLYISGDFTLDQFSTPPFGSSFDIGKININGFNYSPFPPTTGGPLGNVTPLKFIHKHDGYIYTGGDDGIQSRIAPDGSSGPTPTLVISSLPNNTYNGFYDAKTYQDSLLLMRIDMHSDENRGDEVYVINANTGMFEGSHPIMNYSPDNLNLASVTPYKNWLYGFDESLLNRGLIGYKNDGIPFVNVQPINWSGQTNLLTLGSFSHIDEAECQWIEENRFFVYSSDLTSTFGQARDGFAIYCLEPGDAEPFILYDSTICQGDTITFSVGDSDFADGYEWSYSGTGIDLINQGPPTTFLSTEAPTVNIAFFDNFTPGTLTVSPYSDCDSNTINYNRVYSTSVSLNITTNPLPNAIAGLDTILNCYNDTINLFGFSDTANVTYSWNKLNTPFIADSSGQTLTVTDSNYYILTVENPIGCKAFDTVRVDEDKLMPTFDPVTSGILGCGDTIFLLGHCNNLTDTLSWWQKSGSPDTLVNPAPATTEGNYDFYTQNLSNGCVAQIIPAIYVGENINPPNIEMVGYASIPVLTDLFVLDCNNPSVDLKLYSDTSNTVLNYVDNSYNNPIGDSITTDSAGTFYVHAVNLDNNCETTTIFTIGIDTIAPNILFDPITALNCSNDSLILNGSTNFNDTVMTWTNPLIPPSQNPLTVHTPGYYTLTISNNANGCSRADSILIIQDNSIDVIASNDTIVCDQAVATLFANYLGTISGITYLWNNGATTPSTTFLGGANSQAIIEINGDGGCYGTDTVQIDIPPFPVVDFTSFQPCGDPNSGYIVANPISGWTPFDYSKDSGITYQTSNTLTNLSIGNHTVFVRDTLNCEYSYPVSISENSSIATPQFLFSTYNYQSDTVIVVNVSSPPTDSVDWYFSPEVVLLDDNNGDPIIILPDTGSFTITMDGYYGTCISSITKQIFVSEIDTNAANPYNDNGIKSLTLYPNPTNGTFTVDLEFFASQSCTIAIQDMPGNLIDQIDYPESISISQNFSMDLSLNNGTYILRVFSEFDSAYITFILNR